MRALAKAAASLALLLTLANCADTRIAPDRQPAASRASAAERSCLAEAIYFEARGTGAHGEAAVAHVVVNRARSSAFPDSVCGVVADGCQFSYRCDGHSDALADPNARVRAFRTAESVLAGAADITQGALFFHSARAAPGWFDSRPRVGRIGGNVFYR